MFYKKDPACSSMGILTPTPGRGFTSGIRQPHQPLCNRLPASYSDEKVGALASELKVALREHNKSLRTQLKSSLQRHHSDE